MEHQSSIRQYALTHFQAAFVPSKWRKMAVLTMCGMLMYGTIWLHFGAMRWLLSITIVVGGWWSWREPSDFVQKITIKQQQVSLQINQKAVTAHLLSGCLISRYLCCLRWQCANRIIWQWILPDMLPENDFRRIRVWAKWCQY